MIDLVYLKLKAGDGGDGRVSFYRTKGITKGGPNGGDGGRGGNVILRASNQDSTLRHLSGVKEISASRGQNGAKFNKTGRDGEDTIIQVPVGTVVWLAGGNQASSYRRQKNGLQRLLKRDEVKHQKFYLEREGQPPSAREMDLLPEKELKKVDFASTTQLTSADDEKAIFQPFETGKLLQIATLEENGQELIICQGGFGGRGNDAFKSAAHRTPLEAEFGTFGEQKAIFLEARSLADIGLIGLPNAGKSSLLARLTDAQPKIGNYPFTTLEPNLGVINFGAGRGAVIADIPGLVAGASQGKGLGFNFLRHIENCQILVQLFALDEEVVFDQTLTEEEKANLAKDQIKQIRQELASYKEDLTHKKIILVLNKCDLYPQELITFLTQFLAPQFPNEELLTISTMTGQGLDKLKKVLQQALSSPALLK